MLEPRNEPVPNAFDLPAHTAPTWPRIVLPPRTLLWWRARWMLITGAVLLFIALAGVIFGVASALRQQVTYQSQPAASGNLALTVSATGPLLTNVYNVTLPGGGTITAINVNVGDQVATGQALATLDATAARDDVNQAQAALSAARTSLASAQRNVTNVEAQGNAQVAAAYDQEQNAIYQCTHEQNPPPNCVPQAQNQYASARAQASTQTEQARAQVSSAQAQLASAQAQLQAAQNALASATVLAPHAGTVAAINGAIGSSVAGTGASTAFVTIVDLSALRVQAAVSEADIDGVAVGDPVTFTVSALPNRIFHGTVSTISPLGESAQNVVTYPVTISVDTSGVQPATLLPGMTTQVTITTVQRTHVILIPASAVTFARDAAGPHGAGVITQQQAQSALLTARQMRDRLASTGTNLASEHAQPAFVLERAQDAWVVKPVVLGLTNGTEYEVLAGLSANEPIVTGTAHAAG